MAKLKLNIKGLPHNFVSFNEDDPSILEFRNDDNEIIDSVKIEIENVDELQAELDSKLSEETVTEFLDPYLEDTRLIFRYKDETGVTKSNASIDLAALGGSGTSIESVMFNTSTNTLHIKETGTGKIFSVDFSSLIIVANTDAEGNVTLVQKGNNIIQISKAGLTGDYEDLINKPNLTITSPDNSITVEGDNSIKVNVDNWNLADRYLNNIE